MVHPKTGRIYIVTKVELGKPGVYAVDAPAGGGIVTLTRLGKSTRLGCQAG